MFAPNIFTGGPPPPPPLSGSTPLVQHDISCGEISAFFAKIFFFSCDIEFKFTLPNIRI